MDTKLEIKNRINDFWELCQLGIAIALMIPALVIWCARNYWNREDKEDYWNYK